MRVSWTARRSNQSILKEISPGYSLVGLMLKLKLQYFGHLTQRAASFEKTLMLGKIEGRRRRGQQRMRWLMLVVNSLPANAGDLTESGSIPRLGRFPGEGNGNPLQYSCLENPTDRGAWLARVHGGAKSQTRKSN